MRFPSCWKRSFLTIGLCALTTACWKPAVIETRSTQLEYETSNASILFREMDAYVTSLPANPFRLNFVSPPSTAKDEPLITFIHLSDAQIRDHTLLLRSKSFTKSTDPLVGGAERESGLDANDEFPLLAMILAINALTSADSNTTDSAPSLFRHPQFLIHTGDSIDAGTTGELIQFLNVMNRLEIPWFNAMGNHDPHIFGNFSDYNLRAREFHSDLDFIRSKSTFIDMHGISGLSQALSVYDDSTCQWLAHHIPSEQPDLSSGCPQTSYHGFDLRSASPQDSSSSEREATRTSPYYSFTIPGNSNGTDFLFKFVVIDTTADDASIVGRFGIQQLTGSYAQVIHEEQFAFIDREIRNVKQNEYVLIFGHHPLSDDKGEAELFYKARGNPRELPLLSYLISKEHVVGYFCGHTHYPKLKLHSRSENNRDHTTSFIEQIAPSIHEFPQAAYFVSLHAGKNNKLMISTSLARPDVHPAMLNGQDNSVPRAVERFVEARNYSEVEANRRPKRTKQLAYSTESGKNDVVVGEYVATKPGPPLSANERDMPSMPTASENNRTVESSPSKSITDVGSIELIGRFSLPIAKFRQLANEEVSVTSGPFTVEFGILEKRPEGGRLIVPLINAPEWTNGTPVLPSHGTLLKWGSRIESLRNLASDVLIVPARSLLSDPRALRSIGEPTFLQIDRPETSEWWQWITPIPEGSAPGQFTFSPLNLFHHQSHCSLEVTLDGARSIPWSQEIQQIDIPVRVRMTYINPREENSHEFAGSYGIEVAFSWNSKNIFIYNQDSGLTKQYPNDYVPRVIAKTWSKNHAHLGWTEVSQAKWSYTSPNRVFIEASKFGIGAIRS